MGFQKSLVDPAVFYVHEGNEVVILFIHVDDTTVTSSSPHRDGGKRGFEGYSDADGATQDHRRAVLGFAILVDGGAVSWSSKKQELVTLSTMEAEYVGTTHAAKELIWFRQLIGEIFRPLSHPIVREPRWLPLDLNA